MDEREKVKKTAMSTSKKVKIMHKLIHVHCTALYCTVYSVQCCTMYNVHTVNIFNGVDGDLFWRQLELKHQRVHMC